MFNLYIFSSFRYFKKTANGASRPWWRCYPDTSEAWTVHIQSGRRSPYSWIPVGDPWSKVSVFVFFLRSDRLHVLFMQISRLYCVRLGSWNNKIISSYITGRKGKKKEKRKCSILQTIWAFTNITSSKSILSLHTSFSFCLQLVDTLLSFNEYVIQWFITVNHGFTVHVSLKFKVQEK